MNRGAQSNRNDGLVLLYNAAMILEQHNSGFANTGCTLPVASINANTNNSNGNVMTIKPNISHNRGIGNSSLAVLNRQSVPASALAPDQLPVTLCLAPITPAAAASDAGSAKPTRIHLRAVSTAAPMYKAAASIQQQASFSSLAPSPAFNAAPTATGTVLETISPIKPRLTASTVRTSHNELEKSRRAKLRDSIQQLRNEIPLGEGESSRSTMLEVLRRASVYIKELEKLSSDQRARLRQLERRRVELQIRRGQLLRLSHRLKKEAAVASSSSAANGANDAKFGAGANSAPGSSAAPAAGAKRKAAAAPADAESRIEDFASFRKLVRCPVPFKYRQATVGAVSSPDSGYVSPLSAQPRQSANAN